MEQKPERNQCHVIVETGAPALQFKITANSAQSAPKYEQNA